MIAIGDYTISEIYDGESIQGDTGATISTSTEQYYLSNYNDRLSGGSWSDTEPSSIPSGKYLWGRWKFVMTDGTTQYSDAVYRSTIQGIESKVNTLDNSITNKVWQTDINNSISSYDNSTGTAIRNRVTQTETSISGINTTISDMQTDIAGKADGSTVTEMQETLTEVEETAGNTATHFSNIVQTLGTNADGTSASGDVVHRMTDVESGYNGITQRVSATETRLLGQYATSSTGASTQNKVATITPAVTGWELYTGATITVKFTNANTHATPNLNINNTGAKGIRTYSGGTLSEGEYSWKAGDVFTFTYNGTYWLMQDSMTRLRDNETIIQQTANNVLIKATEDDTTAAQGGQHLIQSLINVAPDGVTIDADKVNIEGAAIFNSYATKTDAQGYATTAKNEAIAEIPTNVSELNNDSGYQTSSQVNTAITNKGYQTASDVSTAVTNGVSGKADKTAAVSEEQYIYISKASGTSSVSGTTTWITETGDKQNTWTTKRPTYNSSYPVLFVAKQKKVVSGTVTCTTPLKDDTTTVIDGGHITTGTIDAIQIAANAITADKIATDAIHSRNYTPGTGIYSTEGMGIDLAGKGSIKSPNFAIDSNGNAHFRGELTATKLTIAPNATFEGDIDRFKGASFNWNLLLGTATPVTWTVALNTSNYMVKDCYKTISPVPSLFAVDDLVTISFDWSTNATGGNFHVECGSVTPYGWGTVVKAEGGRSATSSYVDISSSNQSGHFKVTFKVGTAQTGAADTLQWLRIRVDGADTSGKSFTISNAKAERGSNASDWSPAESEIHGVSAVGLAMKVNYSSFTTANTGECYFHGFDANNAEADVDGWVMWNGVKLTITKGMWINPNGIPPANTPILHVFRTSVSPYHADVWWDSSLLKWRGYMYLISGSSITPDTIGDWIWNEVTDCILAVYVATGNEAISSAQLFTTPKKFSELPNPNDIHSIVDTSIDSLEIGGRNLHRLSRTLEEDWHAEMATIQTTTGEATLARTASTGNCRIYQMPDDGYWTWEAGIEYTASIEAKADTAGTTLNFECNSSGTKTYISGKSATLTTEWKRYSCTFTISGTTGSGSMTYSLPTSENGKTIYLRRPMLERGNKPSDWSPAPEDVQVDIDNTNNIISGVRGDLTQTQGNLSRIDSAVENLDGQMQTTYELASGAKSSADEANRKYGEISSIVNDYNNLRNYYLDFNPTPSGINGLIIGARNSDGSDNAFKTQITNDSLNFLQNGSAVAGINANEFFINQGTIETGLRVGNFVIFDEDGALNIKYEPRS